MKGPVFYEGGDILPKLYRHQTLLSGTSDILFTVKDEDGYLYLVSRHTSDANYTEWIVVPSDEAYVQAMLESRISIRDAFLGTAYTVTLRLNRNLEYTEKKYTMFSGYLNKILPTTGYYWDGTQHRV